MSEVVARSGICLGSGRFDHPVLLAPMSGVSDLPFRRLAHRMGAEIVVSEMVACAELIKGRRDVVLRAEAGEGGPFVIQLVGSDPHWMGEAARLCQDLGAIAIDINMGCPAREVTGKQSGSALMRDLAFAQSIIEAVVANSRLPVTLKMRLGWDDKTRNAAELARIAEAAGITMLTVHGRTRCQFFKGEADWRLVRDVTDAVGLPVIVNGDIKSFADLATALSQSGAAGAMVGRGAYGAPWLPARLAAQWKTGVDPGGPSLGQLAQIVVEHVESMLVHYGTAQGLRNARKHVAWYLAQATTDLAEVKRWRQRLCTTDEPAQLFAGVDEFFSQAGAKA
ncbi:MAG: tRNA dihydrouridine synthase DusB [Hyphomicrobiaceae bacterium]